VKHIGRVITREDADAFTFREHAGRDGGPSGKFSDEVLLPGQQVETSGGETVSCSEMSRLGIDAAGNVFPVSETEFLRAFMP
jgi:hypothetical protein